MHSQLIGLPFSCRKWMILPFLASMFSVGNVAYASSPEIDVSGSWRLRIESLKNPVFPSVSALQHQHNQRLSSRFMIKAQANWDTINATVEMYDARVWLDNDDPTLSASQVNTLEPLQFFIGYSPSNSRLVKNVSVGRMTIDHGSRRLISKGVFRNAINSFDGALVDLQVADWNIRPFYFLPVSRLPSDRAQVDANQRGFDKSYTERQLYGIYANSNDGMWHVHSYWFDEEDAPDLATRNRDLYTLGVEFTETIADQWLANLEVIGQTGTSRLTPLPEDITDLDHRSWLVHASLGHPILDNTILRAELDLVSGDNDSSDDVIRGFETLYGVRRFDFGPTDVYQAMPRRNLVAVGARSVSNFTPNHNLMLGYKAFWYQQAPVDVDDFIGHQVEARLRWQFTPALRLEWGGAYLLKGAGFERGAYPDDSLYGYTNFLYKF